MAESVIVVIFFLIIALEGRFVYRKTDSVFKLFIFKILLANLSKTLYNTAMDEMRVRRGDVYRRQRAKKKKRNRIIALALAGVLVVAGVVLLIVNTDGAKGDPTAGSATEYREASVPHQPIADATRSQLSLKVGELCVLSVPEGVDIREVSFSSDNSSVVRIDDSGRIDALGTGTANIRAVAENLNALCECTVTPADPVETDPEERLTTAFSANAEILRGNSESLDIGQYLYSISVNRRTNTVTVYTFDQNGRYTVPVRAMVCSCGRDGGYETPTGEYEIYFRDEWLGLNGDVYGYYISGFEGDFLFHSVPYRTLNHGDLKTEEFNKLGSVASEGCVRMMISDVMWIYENCIVGTAVRVIDEDASADPLGKPPTVKLDGSVKWDPTDPDPANPYRGSKPAITGAENTTIDRGDSFDPASGVRATDTCGNDISARMVIAGTVLSDKPGTYYLTYTVTDDFRQTCEITRTVTVK